MIIVGIDFGDARTGIAVCDKYEMMASDVGYVAEKSFRKMLESVANRVIELNAELIVVGNPITLGGEAGDRSRKCQAFAEELSAMTGIKTVMYDERLTTVAAQKILRENNVRRKNQKFRVDALAARLILEDYMTVRRNTGAEI